MFVPVLPGDNSVSCCLSSLHVLQLKSRKKACDPSDALVKQSGCSPRAASGFGAGFKAQFINQAGALNKTSENARRGHLQILGPKSLLMGDFQVVLSLVG